MTDIEKHELARETYNLGRQISFIKSDKKVKFKNALYSATIAGAFGIGGALPLALANNSFGKGTGGFLLVIAAAFLANGIHELYHAAKAKKELKILEDKKQSNLQLYLNESELGQEK